MHNIKLSELFASKNIITIHSSSMGTIKGFKIGNLVVAYISLSFNDTESHINVGTKYAPIGGYSVPLMRDGKNAETSWFDSDGKLSCKAASGNTGTHTAFVAYISK